MMIRLVRFLIVTLLMVGMSAMRPTSSLAASTVQDCPTNGNALSTDISNAGMGGTVTFTCSSATSIPFTGPITISQDVTLDGSTSSAVTLDGGGTTQLFSIGSGTTLTLKHLTMQGGQATSGNAASDGGAILNAGTLVASASTFTGNAGQYGGAIDNLSGGTVTISDSTFAGNSSAMYSGAIDNHGTLTITNSTVSSNSANTGGAISNYSEGTLTISNSTFSGNSGRVRAGAIDNDGTVTIANSTFAGNFSHLLTGTIANGPDGAIKVGGSIIASNPSGRNCSGTVTGTGYNLTDRAGNCGLNGPTDAWDQNPQLGTLSDNGGPTQTIALQAGSPAIDAIPVSDPLCSSSSADQRGIARLDNGEQFCDIGAYEFTDQATTSTLTASANPAASGEPVTFTATVAQASGTTVPTGTVQFTIDGTAFGSPVRLSGGTAASSPTTSLSPGSHTISVSFNGDPGYLGSSGSLTETVRASRLSGTLSSGFRPVEGRPSSGQVAAFSDSNTFISASQLTATIRWGDGSSSPGTISGSGGHFAVNGAHTYADEGRDALVVDLQEGTPGKASGEASGTVVVAEGDVLAPAALSPTPATANRPYAGPIAAFSDTNLHARPADFSATIAWGDGTTTVGTVSGSATHLVVSGHHIYSMIGHYPVAVTIRDDTPGTARATARAAVAVIAPISSHGALVTIVDNSPCTTIQSAVSVSPTGTASGTLSLMDERPGGTPCASSRPGVLSLRSTAIATLVCTSVTTASIYGQAQAGVTTATATPVQFRADVTITGGTAQINGTIRIQASSGYISGVLPAGIHISGC